MKLCGLVNDKRRLFLKTVEALMMSIDISSKMSVNIDQMTSLHILENDYSPPLLWKPQISPKSFYFTNGCTINLFSSTLKLTLKFTLKFLLHISV